MKHELIQNSRVPLLGGAPRLFLVASLATTGFFACSAKNADSGKTGLGAGGAGVTASGGGNADIDVADIKEMQGDCLIEKDDNDDDGFTVADGDCNDCDPNANPGALDVADSDVDENCDGKIDNQSSCDADLTNEGSEDPLDAAAAIDLCSVSSKDGQAWGVVSARYTLADGTAISTLEPLIQGRAGKGHALLDHFGDEVLPNHGARLLSLSTGIAANPTLTDPANYARRGYQQQTSVSPPSGFPTASTSCPAVVLSDTPRANDSVALELEVRAPTNAKSMSFDFFYFTYEFPEYVCHDYNDNFVVLMDPPPPDAVSGNIAFDNKGNTISVNNAYLEVCDPADASSAGLVDYDCPQGASALDGTGYEIGTELKTTKGAGSGWLSTTVPVTPGSLFTLRFIIWDAGMTNNGSIDTPDYSNDSSVLIDNVRFSAEAASGTVTQPITR